MNIAVLGTGAVGRTIATKLVSLGHDVRMGSRTADHTGAREWVAAQSAGASNGTFADAAAHGEVVFNCTSGAHALDALTAAGAANLGGKVLVDVTNPLDFSDGFPPSLRIANTDSLGETIQREFPDARVVKTLNTVNCATMVKPSRVDGEHDVFVCGNDSGAKSIVVEILGQFGWKDPIDLGDITAARGTEAWLLLWASLYQALGTEDFNLRIVR